jgi:NADPH:quinone reductase-like Zn-dependent oxidoreductase
MKAVVYNRSKIPTTFQYCEVEKPVPQKNEVLVKVHAVSLNAADYRSMRMGNIPKHKIFGADISGVVESVGNDITRIKPGDAVFGDLANYGFGGLAEYAIAPERLLGLKPSGVSHEVAATLPIAALTALQALRDKGEIQPGQKLLVYGAGGGVGNFAVQLGKYYGAKVTAVCGPHNVELVRSLGADQVIDYIEEDIFKKGELFDLILAVNGRNPLGVYKRALTSKGICVMVGGSLTQVILTLLFGWILSIGGRKMRFLAAKPNPKDLEYLIKLVKEGTLKPIIDRRYPLEEAPEAMQYVSRGHARGKVVINVVPR